MKGRQVPPCGSQIMVIFLGHLITTLLSCYQTRLVISICPLPPCALSVLSLFRTCKILLGTAGPLGRMPLFPQCIHYFSFPNPPPPFLPSYFHLLIAIAVSHLKPRLGWGDGGIMGNEERQGLIRRDECGFWGQTWFEFLSLPVANCETLGKLLSLSEPQFPHLLK